MTPVDPAASASASASRAAGRIVETIRGRPGAWLVGIAGIPGAGKSTVAAIVAAELGAVLINCDGYHIPRSGLTPEAMARRGAPWTFDRDAYVRDFRRLRASRAGRFPGFDHAAKDPVADAVVVAPDAPLVIAEGLYLLMPDWRPAEIFDLTVFVECSRDAVFDRLARRHVAAGLSDTEAAARDRVASNDWPNAELVLAAGCAERADLRVSTNAG